MRALVTGGGGYLGGAIIRALLARGEKVASLQRGEYPALAEAGAEVFTGDIADTDVAIRASRGCDTVFHVAGKTGVWGDYNEYHHTNVTGTESIINACHKNNVGHLIYTSSPSVIFDGKDEAGINESAPYPATWFNHYQQTKAIAEQKVITANSDRLSTVALRPHLIWGPADPHLIARILERAGSGKLRLVNRKNLVDTTYIDNAADAHLLAADALRQGDKCAGRVYFISNGEPMVLCELINKILAAFNMPPVSKTVSPGTAYFAGMMSEFFYRLLGISKEPLMTRFVARQLGRDHWYDISAARNDLGYVPRVSIAEGLDRLGRQ